jgi:hypothetical protein
MTFLPIVQRELYVASRRRSTAWVRLLAAMVAVGVAFGVVGLDAAAWLLAPGSGSATIVGARLFLVLTHVAFFGCIFAGILLTADCISAERREDTLGLLFLTDLKGYDVVLGKLASRSLLAIYCLLAILPVAALPLLWGGVAFVEILRVTAVLLNTLFLSLAIGIYVSSHCRERQNAMAISEGILLGVTFLWPLAAGLRAWSGNNGVAVPGFFELTSPVLLLEAAFESSSGRGQVGFAPALLTQGLVTVLLLSLASRRLPHCWQVKPVKRGLGLLQRAWQRWKFGSPRQRAALRRGLLDPNPLCWLGSRDRALRHYLWAATVLLVGVALIMNCAGPNWRDPSEAIGSLFFIHGIIKVMVGVDAGNRFGDLRSNQLLPMIWGTRLSVAEIADGQVLAMRRLFRVPVLAALAYDLFWLFMVLGEPEARGLAVGFQFVCVVAIFLVDLSAIARVGLWYGLKLKRPANATYVVMLQVLLPPWLGVLGLVLLLDKPGSWALTLVWTAGSVLANWVFSVRARAELQNQFHRQVQDRAARTASWRMALGPASPPRD